MTDQYDWDVISGKQASWFISIKTKHNDNDQIKNYEMLNGEAARRESCSLYVEPAL